MAEMLLKTLFAGLLTILLGLAAPAWAQHHMVGAQKCAECHEPETAVWQASAHASSFKDIHRKPEVKDILAAVQWSELKAQSARDARVSI